VGYVNGKVVATDEIVLNHLPAAPHLKMETSTILQPQQGYKYIYRVNCGGPDYKDSYGNIWAADKHGDKLGSTSWTDEYPGTPAFFASQQRTFDKVGGTGDNELFQTFRYGMDKLKFNFPVPDGDYQIELYFTEPWYGTGGGLDCTGWRVFDVAVNGQTKIKNLDIWKEAGYNHTLKKTIAAHVANGQLNISFPNVASGEAIISAIAVKSLKNVTVLKTAPAGVIGNAFIGTNWSVQTWLDIGQKVHTKNADITFSNLPPVLYGAEWFQTPVAYSGHEPFGFKVNQQADVYVGMDASPAERPQWLKDYEVTGLIAETDAAEGNKLQVYRRRYNPGETIVFGTNKGKQMYTVAVVPVSTLEPASDLRKTQTYNIAEIQGDGIARDTVSGKKVVHFNKNSGGSVSYAIAPGVADKYALRIKYYNFTDKTLSAKMQLLAADGTVMKEERLQFKPVAKGKSGTVATDSGTSINAGNYRVIITGLDAEGLSISGIEVQ